jgi:hypothetical protein
MAECDRNQPILSSDPSEQIYRAPCADLTRVLPAIGTFTSRLPTSRSPSSPLGITTTVTRNVLSKGLAPFGMTASVAAP